MGKATSSIARQHFYLSLGEAGFEHVGYKAESNSFGENLIQTGNSLDPGSRRIRSSIHSGGGQPNEQLDLAVAIFVGESKGSVDGGFGIMLRCDDKSSPVASSTAAVKLSAVRVSDLREYRKGKTGPSGWSFFLLTGTYRRLPLTTILTYRLMVMMLS